MSRWALFFGLVLFGLLSCSVSGQPSDCSRRIVPVYLEDSEHKPVVGLSLADFDARVHGTPTRILSIEPDARPRRIILIVDVSHSLRGVTAWDSPWWRWQFAMARHFFDQNRQGAEIALVIFGKGVKDVVGFSEGNPAVDTRLQQATKGYGYLKRDSTDAPTTLYKEILQGLLLFDRPNSADAMYILTDAGDYEEATREDAEVADHLVASQVRLFAVLLQGETTSIHKIPEQVLGPEALTKISRRSGGAILSTAEWHNGKVLLSANPDGKETTTATLSQLYQAILRDSLLEIEVPASLGKSERLELKLSEQAQHRLKHVQIIYSDNLSACSDIGPSATVQ